MQKQSDMIYFDVALITGRAVTLSRAESVRVFLHPWILLTYSGFSLMTVAMDQVPWTQGMPVWLRTAIYFLSSVVGLSAAWLTLFGLSWAVTGGFLRRVHSIIFDLTGAFMSLLTTYILVGIYRPRPDLFSVPSAFLYAFYVVIIVHVSIFLWSMIIPRILSHVRAQERSHSQDLLNEIGGHENRPEDTAQEQQSHSYQIVENHNDLVVVGGTRLSAQAIWHIRAEGNYVRIHTAKSSYFEASTMKMVSSQIPENLGMRIHRSHWISYSSIKAVESDGRKFKVLLKSGVQLPVSRSNIDKVKKLMTDMQHEPPLLEQ